MYFHIKVVSLEDSLFIAINQSKILFVWEDLKNYRYVLILGIFFVPFHIYINMHIYIGFYNFFISFWLWQSPMCSRYYFFMKLKLGVKLFWISLLFI